MKKHISVPFNNEDYLSLRAGDYVYLSGTVYTARDAAHKRLYQSMQNKEELPISCWSIYYRSIP